MKFRWPKDTRESQKLHAYNHVKDIELAISLCNQHRTAIQAGGNVGLWPIRLAASFFRVVTFEPEPITRICLGENTKAFPNIEVRMEALGSAPGRCSIERRSLGSHLVKPGNDVPVMTIDSLLIRDLDLLQLDIEGQELEALKGGVETIRACLPVIQVEMNNFDEMTEFLRSMGYKLLSKQMTRDAVFVHD